MDSPSEIYCPNCGASDTLALAPALYRCTYCRSTFAPKADMRAAMASAGYQAEPSQSFLHSQRTSPEAYLLYGILSLAFCPFLCIPLWFMGMVASRRRGGTGAGFMVLLAFAVFGATMFFFYVSDEISRNKARSERYQRAPARDSAR